MADGEGWFPHVIEQKNKMRFVIEKELTSQNDGPYYHVVRIDDHNASKPTTLVVGS